MGLLIFFLLNAVVLNGALLLWSPEPFRETVLDHSLDVLSGKGGDDSWGAMQVALEHVEDSPGVPLYSEVFFKRQYRFQYPPTALFTLTGLRLLGAGRVQINDFYSGPWPPTNTLLGWIFIALSALATAALLELGLRRALPALDWRSTMSLRVAIVAGLTLTFYPIVKAFTLGQIQVWINGAFALALLAWMGGWKRTSGALIGAIGLIKPHYGVILLWAAWRREWSFAAGLVITVAIGSVASIWTFGWANHIDYLKVLSFLSQHGETYYPNQSVNGLLNRLMSISDPRHYISQDLPPGTFPPFTPWIYALTLASSATILLVTLAQRGRQGDPDRSLDLSAMALACTMASPIAWEHHYGVLLPIYAVALARWASDPSRVPWLAASYVLVSTSVAATNALAGTAFNVAQSTLLVGAAIVLILLLRRFRPAA